MPASVRPQAFRPIAYPEDGPAPCADREAYAGLLKRITAINEHTVVFELCAPDPAFRARIAGPAFAIQDTAWLQANARDGSILTRPNGTGPFRLERWSPGSEMVLTRNEAWWGGPPKPAALAMVWNADPRHRLADLVAGSIDGMDRVRIGDEAKISANPDLVLMPTVGLATAFLGINARTVPFDDPSVREAVALGIDRQALVDAAFPSGSTVARYLTPCSVPHGCRGTAFPEVDRPAAKDLLDQAGFPTFTTTIAYADAPSSYLPNPAAAAENLRSQLAEIGITATLKPQPADAFIAAVDSGKSPGLFLLGTVARMPDVTEFLERNVGSGAGRFGGVDRSLTAALKKAATAVSDDDRAPAYTAVNDALRRTVPLVPLAHPGWNVAYRSDVAAAHTSPLASERFAAMTPGDRRQIAWAQATEPESLYCADEDEADTLRACAQIGESLYAYEPGEASLLPALATDCQTPKPLTTWTCTLRRRVVFHDGSRLDAADVVMSFAAQWDAANPLHRGRTGDFRPFLERFRGFLNPPTP